jgi:CubicO group peptidase (beta-lactamase class C family)
MDSLESSLVAARSAKVLCSAVFVSNRDPEEALKNSVLHDVSPKLVPEVFSEVDVNYEKKEVHIKLNKAPTRIARYYGDQGCVIIPHDGTDVFFQPVKVETSLPDPMTQAWPMGDILPDKNFPDEIDKVKLDAAVDAAFSSPECFTVGVIVVYKGKIIAERYDLGIDKNTQLESWSMGKSITATLIGILIQQGHFGLWDPAPIPRWHLKGDPRSKIRVADLLRMSSGLKFVGANEPRELWERGVPDHSYVYSGAIDVFQFSISRPPEHPPNTVGRYRNCDPLSLGYIIKKTVTEMGEEYLSWPQKALFDRIGIRRQVLEPDPYGNFVMTGFDYGTPRNWARLGLLYLQEGVWQGERILPEGYTEFVSTPAPAWEKPEYGGLFRLNGTGIWNLPREASYMSGAGVNRVFVVPSHELVIVRFGHRRGGQTGEKALNVALAKLIAAFKK